MRSLPARAAFLLAGIAMIVGGPRHPGPRLDLPFDQSTATMLANPSWLPSHLWLLASYVLLLAALIAWHGRFEEAGPARTWSRFAILAVALGVVEMAFHAAAVVDLDRLRAGVATPVLTTHLVLAATVNPILAVALAGLAIHGARARQLGSRWLVWMPILGGLAYGGASPYVVLTHDQRVSPLFAIGTALLAFWFILLAAWPVRTRPPIAQGAAVAGAA